MIDKPDTVCRLVENMPIGRHFTRFYRQHDRLPVTRPNGDGRLFITTEVHVMSVHLF
jgi:hypothetical protein